MTVCKSCGSIDYELKEKRMHIGAYCRDCGEWIKWVSKKEVRRIKEKRAN